MIKKQKEAITVHLCSKGSLWMLWIITKHLDASENNHKKITHIMK